MKYLLQESDDRQQQQRGERKGYRRSIRGALTSQGKGAQVESSKSACANLPEGGKGPQLIAEDSFREEKLSRQMFGFFVVSGDSLIAGYTR